MIEELVLEKENGLKKLKQILAKCQDVEKYEQEVQKSFCKGSKPPMLLTVSERKEIS